jgi:membrane protease YdiL (CAAX protease family)
VIRLVMVPLVAYLYNFAAEFIYRVILGFNEFTPDFPWFVITLVIALASAFLWPMQRWCAWPPKPSIDLARTARLVVLALLLCIAAMIVPGSLLHLKVISWPVPAAATGSLVYAIPIVYPIFGAITEEVCFRGILQGGLSRYIGDTWAIFVATAAFVVAHSGTEWFHIELVFYITFSVLAGILTARSRSIFPAMSLHVAVNVLYLIAPLLGGPLHLREIPNWVLLLIVLSSAFLVVTLVNELKRVPQSVARDTELPS